MLNGKKQYKLKGNIGKNKIHWRVQCKLKSNTGECNTS